MTKPVDPPADHPFERMVQDYQERSETLNDVGFEMEKVALVLRLLKLPVRETAAELCRIEEAASGEARLTFRAFNERFPEFPIVLGCKRLHGLHTDRSALLSSLFNQFSAAPFVTAYEKFYEAEVAAAGARALGLLFPRQGIRNGLIVLNQTWASVPYRGLELVYHGGTKRQEHTLYVRSFQNLLLALQVAGSCISY